MNNKQQTPFNNFNWSEIQKKYLDALMSFNSSTPFTQPPKSPVDSFWVNAMNSWWDSVKPEVAYKNSDLFEQLLKQGRHYYFISEQFSNMIDGIANLNKEDIATFINKKFAEIESTFSTAETNFSWDNIIDHCKPPTDLLKIIFSNMSLYSDKAFDVVPEVKKIRERFLSIPNLGYGRETQETFQEAIKLWADYQDHYQAYQSAMARLNHAALELMRKRIIRMAKKGEAIDSMRQIYDLWIESNETAYQDYVVTEEYSELYGRLVNSLMAFKKKSNELTEATLSAMNIPTSKDVSELERRHYELCKQVKTMQKEIKYLQKQLAIGNKPQTVKPTKKAAAVTKKKKSSTNKNIIKLKL